MPARTTSAERGKAASTPEKAVKAASAKVAPATKAVTRTPTTSGRTTKATKSGRVASAPRPTIVEPQFEAELDDEFDDDFEDEFDDDLEDEPAPERAPGRVFTPPRATADDGRPKASSLLADLWLEREEMVRPAESTGTRSETGRDRMSRPGFPHGKGVLIAAIVAVTILVGGGLGVFLAKSRSRLPTTAAFITKADAVCRTANGSMTAITEPTTYPELATAMATVVTANDAELAALSRLPLPRGASGASAGGAIAALRATDEAAHRLADAAGKKDDAATAAATSMLVTQFADASVKARAFGFTACTTGMQTGIATVAGGARGLVRAPATAKTATA